MILRTTLFAAAAAFIIGTSAASAQVQLPPRGNPPGSATGDENRSRTGTVNSFQGNPNVPGSRTGERNRSETGLMNSRKGGSLDAAKSSTR